MLARARELNARIDREIDAFAELGDGEKQWIKNVAAQLFESAVKAYKDAYPDILRAQLAHFAIVKAAVAVGEWARLRDGHRPPLK